MKTDAIAGGTGTRVDVIPSSGRLDAMLARWRSGGGRLVLVGMCFLALAFAIALSIGASR